jgi:hypothetical protein
MFDPKLSLNSPTVNSSLQNKLKIITSDESNGISVNSNEPNEPQDVFTPSSLPKTDSSLNTVQVWLAKNPSTNNVSEFDLKKIFQKIGLDPNKNFNSFEEVSNLKGNDGQSIPEKIQAEMRQYLLAPLTELQGKDLSSLTPTEEKKFVQDVFDRANEVGGQIVKSVGSKHLRANTLNILTRDLTGITNSVFESLPSFQGENDNQKILAEKFGLVYNITNDDFINEKPISYEDLTSKKGYYAAPRAGEITKYNPFVNIAESEKVPSDLQASLSKLFPTVPSKSFETINTVDDPSMSFRGANISTEGGSKIPLINPKNIVKVAQNQGITDPSQIEVMKNGVIANELTHSAMGELFGNLTSDKSFFANYSDPFYHSMNNQQFEELISDVVTVNIDPKNAIVFALKVDESRREYTDKTVKRYLEGKGFTLEEINKIESADDNQRQSLLESLAKNKNLEIGALSSGFRDHLLELGGNLIKHAQTQNIKK